MKVVFIEPRSSGASVYSKLHMPLLGPVYLATILRDRGHEVRVYHEDICAPDYSKLDADLVGISILTSTAKRGYEIAKKFPRDKVIIGGVHASLMPQEASQYARQIVVGEAEEVITAVAEGTIKDSIVHAKPIQDLDSLPIPDFSLIKGYNASGLVPISTSRGCPFDCSFCSVTKMFGRKFRFRSAENVIEELRSREAAQFFFCDDNFTAYPKRAHALLSQMLKLKIRRWACQVRCDVTRNKEMLELMAHAGCKVVCVGFESINSKTLEAYEKKQSVGDIVNAIHSFHEKRIKVHGMFVLGSDNDDTNTVWDTFRFAVKQKIDTIQMSILTPFPGTKVNADLEAEKRIFSRDWDLYDGQHIVFQPKLLGAKELQLSVLAVYLKFYSLSWSFMLLFKLHLRNAMFRFMGHAILKTWLSRNRSLHWLPALDSNTNLP
ncbi:MAG: radical SAM protein [Candidatus Omnitrophota bacterium]